MVAALQRRLLDFGFVIALLVLAAVLLILLRSDPLLVFGGTKSFHLWLLVPLILLRNNPLLGRPELLVGLPVLFVGVAVFWAILGRRREDAVPAEPHSPHGVGSWRWTVCVAGLLAVVVYVGFYQPLRIHFWSGTDEFVNLRSIHSLSDWLAFWRDWDGMNRPLMGLPCVVGQALTPRSVEGFLWLGAGLCWANGLLLSCLLREAMPQTRVLPTAAAVLLIINPAEPQRFFVMFASNFYWTSIALLLASVWLFLRSYRFGSRLVLVLSCLLLAGSLLIFEAGYPLALLAPLLAWFDREHRRRLPVWASAWFGAIALLAIRFLLYLASTDGQSYQAITSAPARRNPAVLLANLGPHLEASLGFFATTGAARVHWKSAACVLAAALTLVALAGWRGAAARCRPLLLALGLSALALLLSQLPFLYMPFVGRTQFFAAPAQATLLGCALGLIGGLLGRRVGGAAVAVCVGLLAGNSTAEALSRQEQARRQSPISFERTVHIFQQIHAASPNLSADTLVLLVPDGPEPAPRLLYNYACVALAYRVLNASIAQVGLDAAQIGPVFQRDGVLLKNAKIFGYDHGLYHYDQVLAFGLAADGAVRLLHRIPARLLPRDNSADCYDPLPLLRSGPVDELPFLRYPSWAERPRDLFDMGDGVLLGAGWGQLEWRSGAPSRAVAVEAELVVNSLGQSRRDLHLHVQAPRPGRLEALDAQGRTLAGADLHGPQDVNLVLAVDASRVGLVRMRAVDAAGAPQPFRAFGPPGPTPRGPAAPPDIAGGGLVLGDGWYPRETTPAGDTFRGVGNAAEIVVEESPRGRERLLVDVAPGPGLDGHPAWLTLRDEAGQTLAAACVGARQQVGLPLPAGLRPGTALRLHVEGGGRPHLNDPGTLNLVVFEVTLTADHSADPGE